MSTARPVVVAAGILAALGGVEAWARVAYEAPSRLDAHLDAMETGPGVDVVLFGTCLGERFVDAPALAAAGEPDWRLHNLSGAATGPMDWALAVRNRLDGDIEGMAFLMTDGELAAGAMPWESQVMELASWRDLPDITAATCTARDCALEYAARFGSHALRYRERIGNRAWAALGASPGTRAQAAPVAAAPVPKGGPDPAEMGARWLERALRDARARGVPTAVVVLPNRDGVADVGVRRELERIAGETGAAWVPPFTLSRSDFEDESHPTAAGARNAARPIAEVIRALLAGRR